MQPIIGITTYQKMDEHGLPYVMNFQAYIQAVLLAGGIPVLIPSLVVESEWETLYSRLDGILLTGGGDISLDYFNGEQHARIDGVDPKRDALELALLRAVGQDKKPFLGICRGIQVVNVGLGGSLYTHIPDQLINSIDHTYPGNMRTVLVHDVEIAPGSLLEQICGVSRLRVNSLHHQGLKELAPGLRGSAHAPDGLVEAVELIGHPFGIAVQWHPEWLTDQLPTRNLFKAFIVAAGRFGTSP